MGFSFKYAVVVPAKYDEVFERLTRPQDTKEVLDLYGMVTWFT